MNQLDLFADDIDEPATPNPADAPRHNLADLPPAPAPVTLDPRRPQPSPVPPKDPLQHYRPASTNPHEVAFDLADAVSYAWHHAQGGSAIEVPVGVVAALALWPLRGPDAYLAANWWLSLDDRQLLAAFRECWARWWIMRPDLIDRATPLHKWVDDEQPAPTREGAVRAVVEAALTKGLLHLTSSNDAYTRSSTDVMGALLTVMRSPGAHDALAEVHTPPSITELMARMTLDGTDLQPGMRFDEPAGGTGGMYRAAAQALRDRGLDPHDFGWSLTDIDPVAAAGAAVNAIIWDLGPHVLIACGDTLHEGNLQAQAATEARESLARRDRLQSQAAFLAALKQASTLIQDIAA
ncbi:N-6 DNA methylase [Streptomyces longispororuber]|uniref:N-6 DNA methylase n=1 Tax=Streptomyces longispororuber TaxID=68230 RepID=UPI00340610AB